MSFEVDVKRFYVPEEYQVACPKCGHNCPVPNGYLSYPTANVVFEHTVYCPNEWEDEAGEWVGCYHEWPVKVRLNVSFELIAENND